MNSDLEHKFNEWWLKSPLLKLISAQTTACYKPRKIRIFPRDIDQKHRQNHWIQQSSKTKYTFSLWYRWKSSLNILRFLKSITSEAFKNKQSCSAAFALGCVRDWHLQGKQDWIQNFWHCTDQSSAAELLLAHSNYHGRRNSRQRIQRNPWRWAARSGWSCGTLPSLSPQLLEEVQAAKAELDNCTS